MENKKTQRRCYARPREKRIGIARFPMTIKIRETVSQRHIRVREECATILGKPTLHIRQV